MFKSLAAGFNRCSENKKNSAYRQVDSPTNSDAPTYLENDKPEGKATTQASSEKDKPEEKATAQAMQQHESYVQVCPHERLSFERFQRIQDLMRNVKDRRLDALSAMPKNHENMQSVQSFESRMNYPSMYDYYQICRPKAPTSGNICVQVQAAYKSTDTRDGLDLLSFWKIEFKDHQYNREAFTQIQDLLEPFHVSLCPHRRLHDADIVSKIVSMMVPTQRDPDPVRRLEKTMELRQCQSCTSMFEFRLETRSCIAIVVKRIIKAKTAEDASWLAHCSSTEDKK